MFRRYLHSHRNLRAGLSIARDKTDARVYPRIVSDLSKQKIYANLLVGNAFPENFSRFQLKDRLQRTSTEKEFIWTASVLSVFLPQLQQFVKLKLHYEIAFADGNFSQAATALDSIESKLGVSLWLIANRLQLLQLQSGLKAQKDYLEQTITVEGLNEFVAYVAYYFSYRSEENVSLSTLEIEIENLVKMGEMGEFFRYLLLPYDITQIRDISAPLTWSEPYPIVDRFQVLVSMIQLKLAREGTSSNAYLKKCLLLLENVSDSRIERLLNVYDGSHSKIAESSLDSYDAYTIGKYNEVLTNSPDTVELVARTRASLSSENNTSQSSFLIQTQESMKDVLLLARNHQQAISQLKKLALTFSHHPLGQQIASFVERKHEHIFVKEYSELDKLAALTGASDNPWNAALLAKINCSRDYIDELLSSHSNSPALRIQKALDLPLEEANLVLDDIGLPKYRKAIYKGHVAFHHRDYKNATACFKEAVDCGNKYIQTRAKAYLFNALFAQGQLVDSLRLAVDHCLQNSNAFRLYPLEELARACLNENVATADLAFPILLHITARQIHPKWEQELSDVFENTLYELRVESPISLVSLVEKFDKIRLIYFLRFICVPRIFDDTTLFESVSAIENERILICQNLILLDPSNSEIYAAEIKSITRDAKVAELFQQVEESKIYVDEDGIYSAVEDVLRDAYARYIQMLKHPSLDYQADKITKRIEVLLGENAPSDFKNLKLPASEKEGLFISICNEFITQFATNPAFGLDTHFSTTIRHGAFEGHVRSPLAAHDLLLQKSNDSDEHILPERWQQAFTEISPEDKDFLRKQLAKFTVKVEELERTYRKDYLQVRGDPSIHGMFDFVVTREERLEFMNALTESTPFDDFIERLFAFAWHLTDRSMEKIRERLRGPFLSEINHAADLLISAIERRITRDKAVVVTDSVVRAKTDLQVAVENICGWFRRPTDFQRAPFDIDLAIGVALKQIENCYAKDAISPRLSISSDKKIPGKYLDGTVEVLFILLQNVVRHSGFSNQTNEVKIIVVQDSLGLDIEIENKISPSINIYSHKRLGEEAVERYSKDTALKMARSEGGSGLSKIWRILEFDFKATHALQIIVSDNHSFNVRLSIRDMETFV